MPHPGLQVLRSAARPVVLALALLAGAPPAFSALTGARILVPELYGFLMPPAAGRDYRDRVFRTSIRRVTDAFNQPDTARGGNLDWVVHEYSTMSPFSEDARHLLLVHETHFALYSGTGRFVRDLPQEIHALSEPRWSRHDQDLFYYVNGNELKHYDVRTGAASVVRDFAEYARISGLGESDISTDGDRLVLVGDSRDIFVYRISTDEKGPALSTLGLGLFDQVYITPDNNVLVGWLLPGILRFQGVEMYDQDMRFLRQVAPAIGHMDVARDVSGEEVLLFANAGDPLASCPNAVEKIRLGDGFRSCLLTFDFSLALHISAPDDADWFLVSTYAPSDPYPLLGWVPYTNEILQVALDGSEVRRLAHHRSRPFNAYNYQPRAAVSRDGSKVAFSSNFGLQEILGHPAEYSDVYLISRPGGARRGRRFSLLDG